MSGYAPNALILDRYRIEKMTNQGDYNLYYDAEDTLIGRPVMLKVLRRDKSADPASREIFLESAHLTARLEHPHIDVIYDIGEYADHLFLVRRMTSNGSINRTIRQQRYISIAEKLRILREVAEALDFAHSHNVIHCNLKPSNVRLDDGDRAYLIDFMNILPLRDKNTYGESLFYLTYMPLERLEDKELTTTTDVFSLAATAFAFLSGETPFKPDIPERQIEMRQAELPRISDHVPAFSSAIDEVLLKSLDPDPRKRHQSPTEFIVDLTRVFQVDENVQNTRSLFISYAREDKSIAAQIVNALKDNHMDVWFDQLSLVPGEPWEPAIRKAIKGCDKMIVILSPESVDSRYVQAEIDYAVSKEREIIPIMHRSCDVPLQIRLLQYIDFGTMGYNRGIELLMRACLD